MAFTVHTTEPTIRCRRRCPQPAKRMYGRDHGRHDHRCSLRGGRRSARRSPVPGRARQCKSRAYLPAGFEITYGEAGRQIEALAALYRQAGYGVGHRVATLLENRPEHVLHTLALNSLGVCCVPINPDYRAAEIAYLVDHSEPDLVLTLDARRPSIEAGAGAERSPAAVVVVGGFVAGSLAPASRPARDTPARPRDAGQHPLHLGHDRPAQGLRAVARLRDGVRRLVRRARRRGRPAHGRRIASTIRCRSIMPTPASCP